jgi:thiosulfate dehydrogenase
MKPFHFAAALLSASALAGCPEAEVITEHRTAVEQGADLFGDASLSDGPANRLACSDCHGEQPGLTGGSLAGVTKRKSFWGGQENTLLRSINACRYYFQLAQEQWTGEEDEAIYIYAYLESLEGDGASQPFSIGSLDDPGEGDEDSGRAAYKMYCESCHGLKNTGSSALTPTAPILPDDTLAAHSDALGYDDAERRIVFVQKTRHGGFLGYGGVMPPFSVELLSDQDLADILTYLRVP